MSNAAGIPRLLFPLVLAFFLASPVAPPGLTGETSPAPNFLARVPSGSFELRLMSWNVMLDSVFPPDGARRESFARIVKAVNPDVLCLQEIRPRQQAGELGAMMDRLLPLPAGAHWQSHFATNLDVVMLSHYPLRRRAEEAVIPRPLPLLDLSELHMGQVMCLVDLPDSLNVSDLYVISTHFISRADDDRIRKRQRHADAIMRWVRGLRQGGHADSLAAGTPIVILGDLNVYEATPNDAAHHLATLLTGNLVDEATFGADFKPDWDGTYLVEVKPRHNGRDKDWYTWRNDSEPFPPGALDRILYTDSVMQVRKSFVLNTTTMRPGELAQSGLLATDVLNASQPGEFDHLPLVTDFALPASDFAKPKPVQ